MGCPPKPPCASHPPRPRHRCTPRELKCVPDGCRWPWRRHEVDSRLDAVSSGGLKVVRTWAFSLGNGTTPALRRNTLQIAPGVYDESVFLGLDYALDALAKRGLRVILTLTDFWLNIWRQGCPVGGRAGFAEPCSTRGVCTCD